MATRIIAIGIICIGSMFSVWQFIGSSKPTINSLLPSVPLIPAPSTQSMVEPCEARLYLVQESDTLESIAKHVLVSKEDIKSMNNLGSETLQSGREILIPICTSTPTGTVNALTTMYTPSTGPITTTPDA